MRLYRLVPAVVLSLSIGIAATLLSAESKNPTKADAVLCMSVMTGLGFMAGCIYESLIKGEKEVH